MQICSWIVEHIPLLEELIIANRYEELPHGDDFDYSDRSFNRRYNFNYGENLASIDYTDFGESGDLSDDEVLSSSDDESLFGSDDEILLSSDDDTSFGESESEFEDLIEFDIGNLDMYILSAAGWDIIHSSLAKMPNLRKLWIRSYFDCCIDLIHVMHALAKRGVIEELTIQAKTNITLNIVPNKEAIPFTNFESVERFRIISPSVRALHFFDQLIAAMPNVKTFIVDVSEACLNVCDLIIMIVERSANIEALMLKMPPTFFNHMLYMKLKRIQKLKCVKSDMVKPLKIYISSERLARICKLHLGKEYNDKLIAINATTFTDWFEHPF